MNVKKIMSFAIGPIGAAFLGLITLPIIAWFFSPEDIGRLTMLQVAISFTLLLFSLGLDQAYVREYYEVNDKSSLLKSVICPGLIILSVTLLVISFIPSSVSRILFGIDSTTITILLFFAIFISFISRFLSLILRMQERGLAYSMSQLLPKIIFLMIVLCYVWVDAEANFNNLMIANVSSLAAVFIIYVWNTRKDWRPALTAKIDKSKQKAMIIYAMPLICSGIAFWGLTALDKLFLRGLSTFEELGVYSLSVSFAAAALVFQAIFSTVWAPIIYRWAAEGLETEKVKDVMDYITLGVIIIWSLTGMFSWLLSYILPPEYIDVQRIVLVAMAYPLLYTLSEVTGVGISIQRRTVFVMVAALSALIVNIIGNWIFIPLYGAAGAAIASSVAFFIFLTIRTEASSKLWKSFERLRMYSFVLIALTGTFIINIFNISVYWLVSVSFIILILVLLSFMDKVLFVINFLCIKLQRKY